MSKKALVVVSYGTSYIETREKTIGAVENELAAAFPDRDLRRAFTARMVIDIVKKKEGKTIDHISDALAKLADEGYDDILVQSTHIVNGGQFDFVTENLRRYRDRFKSVRLGMPLLTAAEDYGKVIEAIWKEFYPAEKDSALVIMGHGSVHYANATYSQLQLMFHSRGMDNVYVTTAGRFPDFPDTVKMMRGKGYRKVRMIPLLVVAGDHVTNDLVGPGEGSLFYAMKSEGYEVEAIGRGLGEYGTFRQLFVEHAKAAQPF